MKRFFIWMLVFTTLLTFISCDQSNSPSQNNNDVGKEITMQIGYSGPEEPYGLTFFEGFVTGSGYYSQYYDYKFVDFGKANKLSQINYIPTDGWVANGINISVGHGYIVRADSKNNDYTTYMRMYIKEFIDKGEVKGYRIVYQTHWNPLYE